MPTENVNHPNHYGGKDNPFEPVKIINYYHLNFDLGNVIKYTLRAGKKDNNSKKQDLQKALWYLQNELEKEDENV